MENTQIQMKRKAVLICKRGYGKFKCQNVSGDNKLQLCDEHFQLQREFLADNPSLLIKEKREIFGIDTPILTKKKKEKNKKGEDLPPDEQRCFKSDGIQWRCKNVRMWVDAAEEDDDSHKGKYCRQHYTYYVGWGEKKKEKKKRSGVGECAGGDASYSTNCSNKRRKKAVAEDDRSLEVEETGTQLPATTSDKPESDKIIQGGSASIGSKRKYVERLECSGELESLTRNKNPVVELESLENYMNEFVKMATEFEMKKVECTTLHGKLAEADTRMTAVTDATECWEEMLSDLERRFMRIERVKLTIGSVEARILNLENLVLRMDNENSTVAGSVESRILKLESLVLRSRKPFVNVVSDVGVERTRDRVVELESLEHFKSECVKFATEFEKNKVECTTLQGKLAEVATAITAVTDATECWGKLLSDLESRFLRMERKSQQLQFA